MKNTILGVVLQGGGFYRGQSAKSIACSLLIVGLCQLPAIADSSPAMPGIVTLASEVFAKETRGVIGFERHFETRIHAGPVIHTELSDGAFIMSDGAYMKLKYERIVQDGNFWSRAKLDERTAQTNAKWGDSQIQFKEPYDHRYLGDYKFVQSATCGGCPAGAVSVDFTSEVRDAQHGDGTMLIDRLSGHVLKLSYTPNKMPHYATSGTVTETGGVALPDLWYPIRIEEGFRGHAFLLSGKATFGGTFDHFRRFDSAQAALDALSSNSI